MTRLIDADALEKAIYEWMPKNQEEWLDGDLPPIENLVVSIMMTIQEQPTIDAEPVRHGRWIQLIEYDIDENAVFQCSVCGGSDMHAKGVDVPYCWHCGARMDKE